MSDPQKPNDPPAEPIAPVVPPATPEAAPVKEPVAEAPKEETSPLGPKKEAAPTDPAAPIKYDFKVPEGLKLDEKQTAAFTDLGNKLKLAPEAAQELLDFYGTNVKELVTSIAKQTQDAAAKVFNDLIGTWKKGIETDPELSGANGEALKNMVGAALDKYGSDDARKGFELTGAGWNPAVIKFIGKMAQALAEGAPVDGGNPPGAKRGGRTPGEMLFGKDN